LLPDPKLHNEIPLPFNFKPRRTPDLPQPGLDVFAP
jgi:hypothetical protein